MAKRILEVAGALSLLWLVAWRLGHLHGRLDLLAHFQVQALALSGAGTIAAAVARSRLGVALLGATALGTAAEVAPLVLSGSTPPAAAAATSLRVTAINVRTENQDVPAAADAILGEGADVVLVQEVDGRWADGLDGRLEGYTRIPTDTLRSDNFGIALYLRDGVDAVRLTVHTEPGGVPWFDAVLRKGGRDVQLVGMHPLPPFDEGAQARRDEQIEAGERALLADPLPGIVCGDLNATIWSAPLRALRTSGTARPAALGHGLRGSWPSGLWFTGMILIDHVWTEPGIGVLDFRVSPHFGSDHRAVTADLVY